MSTDNPDLTNGLSAQCTLLCSQIDTAQDSDDLQDCVNLITFASLVWASVGYGYKIKELVFRLKGRAKVLLAWEQDYLANCRKNCRTRYSTENEIQELKKLV